jgi:uncharacterized membrane protein
VTGPSRRDRFRPFELVGLSAVIAGFVGAVVFASTRSVESAFVFGGLGFIVCLVSLAMLALMARPTEAERIDLARYDAASPDASEPEVSEGGDPGVTDGRGSGDQGMPRGH